MRRLIFFSLLIPLLVACASPSFIATSTPNPPTFTPPPTPTAIPTLAPLPSPIALDVTERDDNNRADIRIIQAHPNLQDLDVYLSDTIIAYRLRYGRASQAANVPAGNYQLELRSAGSSPEAPALAVMEIDLSAQDDKAVVILTDGQTVEFVTLDMDKTPTASDGTRLRIVPAITGITELTLDINGRSYPQLRNIRARSVSNALEITAGEANLTFNDNTAIGQQINLRPQKDHILVLAGATDDIQIIDIHTDVPTRTQIVFANASESIGVVDVYVDNVLYFEGIAPTASEEANAFSSGDYVVSIFSTGDNPETAEALLTNTVRTIADNTLYLVLVGPANNLQLVQHQDSDALTRDDQYRITYIHTLDNPSAVHEINQPDAPVRISFARPITRTYLANEPTTLHFVTGLNNSEGHTLLDVIDERTFSAGTSYILLVMGGTLDGADYTLLERIVGTKENPTQTTRTLTETSTYLINTLEMPLQVLIDGTITFSRIEPFTASDYAAVSPGTHTIVVNNADTLETLYMAQRLFQVETAYSLVVYGDSENANYTLSEYPNNAIIEPADNSSAIRFINATLINGRNFTLAYARVDAQSTAIEFNSQAPLPPDAQPLNITAISSGRASVYDVLPAGNYQFYVYDETNRRMWSVSEAVTVSADNYVDVVSFATAPESPPQTQTFTYPKP